MYLAVKRLRRGRCGTVLAAALASLLLAALAPPAGAADESKAAAWAIGHNLSLAALLYAQGGQQPLVEQTLGKAKSAAAAAGVDIKPFPPAGKTKGETTAAIIHYLIKGEGWSTAEALASKHGQVQGMLFELAVKSNLGIILYQPGDDSGLASVIKARSEAIHLPSELWMPLVTAMNDKRPPQDVKQAIFKMHDDVAAALVKEATAAPKLLSPEAPATVGELLQRGGARLTGAQIAKLFAGATINGTAMGTQDSKFELRYMADGTASGEGSSPGGSIKISGTWSTNERDQYCQNLHTASGTPIQGCFDYFMMSNRLFAAPTDDKTAPVYERHLKR